MNPERDKGKMHFSHLRIHIKSLYKEFEFLQSLKNVWMRKNLKSKSFRKKLQLPIKTVFDLPNCHALLGLNDS